MSQEIDSHILRKYEILQMIGRGAYGTVWKGIDKKTQELVAIKKYADVFQCATDTQDILKEIILLQELNGHSNILNILNLIRGENDRDIYIITDCMETDLHSVIRANILMDAHRQYICYQILKAMKYIHTGQLLHKCLKPRKILLNSDCVVKVVDFTSAHSVVSQEEMSHQDRRNFLMNTWYRAPEQLLGSNKYSTALDIWNVGCILGEMLEGRPIFPGSSTMHQLELIFKLTGRPSQEDLKSMQSTCTSKMLNCIPISNKIPFYSFFPSASEDALDLLKKLLKLNPHKRITAEQALRHKYFSEFHEPDDEISCPYTIKIANYDEEKFSMSDYREEIFYDISRRMKEIRRRHLIERGCCD